MIYYDGFLVTHDPDTVSFVERNLQTNRHYVGTRQNKVTDHGRLASSLSLSAIVRGQLEVLRYKGWFMYKTPKNLLHNNILYRSVVTGPDAVWVQEDDEGDIWSVKMDFIINNPTPYDPDTGEALI